MAAGANNGYVSLWLDVVYGNSAVSAMMRIGGDAWRYPAYLLTSLQLNTRYVLRFVADDGGRGFYVEAYQESDPSVRGAFTQGMPAGDPSAALRAGPRMPPSGAGASITGSGAGMPTGTTHLTSWPKCIQ